ncbi:MAG: adenine specific DNA methyltransferase/N-6 DNA methylase [Treponematales bacterium]
MDTPIQQYRAKLRGVIDYGGSLNETSIRSPFIDLVNAFAEGRGLLLVPELEYRTAAGTAVYPDGTLKDRFRLSYGYYEAKDPKDDLDREIEDKTRKNYPLINTIFENSRVAVLYQNQREAMRIDMADDAALKALITAFVDFEREEIYEFHAALAQFKTDLPNLVAWCRDEIDGAKDNAAFAQKADVFLKKCRDEINPDFSFEDVREILVQHMLTGKLFQAVLSEADFHRENNIARSIEDLVAVFFTREKKKEFEEANKHFYNTIALAAAQITDYHDKQDFLKTLYEEFYKSYNPKEADRLGVVYTPAQIVGFMIRVTDSLLEKHFNTGLAEKNVRIIDPATGTGTFVASLIDYIPPEKLRYKYTEEIFANEVRILPYYVACVNIEYTYWQKTGEYREFPNICYTDTLDYSYYGVDASGQAELDGLIFAENLRRLNAQNESVISVVIGNPPYNANQKNFNEQNANRAYPKIDKRIRETFSAASTAQKKKYEDMYLRFFRWAFDRLDEKSGGIVAFVSNRSYIDAINTDGFRARAEAEFDFLYVFDTQSDVRKNPRISGTKYNVFGIQTGVAILFAVKLPRKKARSGKKKAALYYHTLRDEDTREEKLQFLKDASFESVRWQRLYPNARHDWLNISASDFDTFMPLTGKDGLFHTVFPGVNAARNDWLFDFSKEQLIAKVKYFIEAYNRSIDNNEMDYSIKWSETLVRRFEKKTQAVFDEDYIQFSLFRPFVKKYYYGDPLLSDRFTGAQVDCASLDNRYIAYSGKGHNHPFTALASKYIPNLDAIEKGQVLPLFIKDAHGHAMPNVRGEALKKLAARYRYKGKGEKITPEAVFCYVYAVLNDRAFVETYKDDLRRESPRVPLRDDFSRLAALGKRLLDLHVTYEDAAEYPLEITNHKGEEGPRIAADDAVRDSAHIIPSPRQTGTARMNADKKNSGLFLDGLTIPGAAETAGAVARRRERRDASAPAGADAAAKAGDKPPGAEPYKRFRLDREAGCLVIDNLTVSGIPPAAFAYRLSQRSAVEWLVDQYKSRKIDDAVVVERFNAHGYGDYRDDIVSFVKKIVTVSLETLRIRTEMRE